MQKPEAQREKERQEILNGLKVELRKKSELHWTATKDIQELIAITKALI